jgi:hypothetical protein
VALEELEHSAEQLLRVSWVLIQFATQAIQENVLVVSHVLHISNQRL